VRTYFGIGVGVKDKWAAEVETTAEDIKFLGKISGNAGLVWSWKPRRQFRFLFAF
jgi:hypothetical protein